MNMLRRASMFLAGVVLSTAVSAQDVDIGPLDALQAGNYDQARSSLSQMTAGQPEAALHLAYLEGLIRMREANYEDAADIFRSILAVAPDYEPARRELAFALASMGETDGAIYHAERLMAQTSDERLRSELTALIANTSRGKTHGVGVQFAILPSSNVSKGTSEEVIVLRGVPFVIDSGSRARSGVGLSFGISAWKQWTMDEDWSAILNGTVSAQIYDETEFNEQTASLKLDFRRQFESGWFSFSPVVELTFVDREIGRKRAGLSLSGYHLLSSGNVLSAGLTHWWQSYPKQDYRDGTVIDGYLGYQHAVSPTASVSVTIPFERERTKIDHLDHDDLGVVLGYDREWGNGLITGFTVGMRRDQYIGDFPSFDMPREDVVSTFGASILHRSLAVGRFAPRFSYTYTSSDSTVSLFDYDSHDVAVSLSTRF